jgi:hypothetical protein
MAEQTEVQVSETEFKTVDAIQSKSFEDEQRERFQNQCKGWAASCEVEIDRIEKENGVRIGNSILNEAFAKAEITKALKAIQTKYLSLC